MTKHFQNVDRVSMMLNFAEMTNFESMETGTYPLSALLSDLGGAAGLWLVLLTTKFGLTIENLFDFFHYVQIFEISYY